MVEKNKQTERQTNPTEILTDTQIRMLKMLDIKENSLVVNVAEALLFRIYVSRFGRHRRTP